MKQKRGQIAIFLILAVIVLIGGIVFFASQEIVVETEKPIKPEFAPVKQFVEQCIKQTADEGIARIGMTGGYIDYPERFNDPRSYLEVLKGSGLKNPYWWFDGISAIPQESFIKEQLEFHIKSSSIKCVNNFEILQDIYNIDVKKDMDVSVSLNEEDVSVKVKYPLRVALKGGQAPTDIKQFSYTSNVRLKMAYRLAKSIIEVENKDGFIEKRTFDLMALAGENEIPINGYETAVPCVTKKWSFPQIRERLKELLTINLAYIKVKGTDFSTETYVPNPCTLEENKDSPLCKNAKDETNTYGSTYFKEHYIWELAQQNPQAYSSMKVGLRMTGNFNKFEARPREGQLLKSKSQGIVRVPVLSRLACFNMWHFTYDVSYPVLATIYDKPTSKNEPFLFNFAFKVNIDHNYPKRESTGVISLESETGIADEEYCGDVTQGQIILRTASDTGEPVEDAELSFTCGQYICNLGKTQPSQSGDTAGIITRLPRCTSAVVTTSKEGYVDSKSSIVVDNRNKVYEIVMKGIKEFPKCYSNGECTSFRIFKHELKRPSSTTKLEDKSKDKFIADESGIELEESSGESAVVFVKEVGTDFESSTVFPFEKDSPLIVLKHATNKYDVEIYLMKDDKITGAYKGAWSTLPQQVADAKEIMFHAVSFEPLQSSNPEEADNEFAVFLDNVDKYSSKIPPPQLN